MTLLTTPLALVTGASSGIGAATAQALARHGARVLLIARSLERLNSIAALIRSDGGQADVIAADLADPAEVDRAVAHIRSAFGIPDILINSAGAGRWLYADETSPREVVEMMNAPYFCAFYVTRALLPDLLKRNSGHIVNINSPAAKLPWPGATAYTGARWAMMGLTHALRADLYGTRLKVHSIVAGKTTSPYWEHNPGALDRAPRIARLIPDLTAEQVADAILDAIHYNRLDVIIPPMLRLFYALHTLAPRLVERLVWSTGYHRQ